jgi:hypothetical protein
MDDLKVNPVSTVDIYTIKKVLSSSKLTDTQKVNYIKKNSTGIKHLVENEITSEDYIYMMKGRPLEKFRPFKNSFTKGGDKMLLAKALQVDTKDVDHMIDDVTSDLQSGKDLDEYSEEQMEKMRTYVYRHGKKDQLVSFLDYKLGEVKDVVKYLYRTLEYNTGGVADYFIRPIHRMDNKTLLKLYNTIDKHLSKEHEDGKISFDDRENASKWALIKLYHIQNNSKLINAIKTYRKLK